MVYLAVGTSLLLLTGLTLLRRWYKVQPITTFIYGFSALILSYFQLNHWAPMYVIRYFLYVISGFLMIFIPLILLCIAALILLQLHQSSMSLNRRLSNGTIVISFIGLIIWMGYAFFTPTQLKMDILIEVMMTLSVYFIALFISFIIAIICIHVWPIASHPTLIMVLGYRSDAERVVSRILKLRLDKALVVYQRQSEPESIRFLVTGGGGKGGISEAEMMAQYLGKHGVSRQQILLEDRADNTATNFSLSRQMVAHQLDEHQVILVTSFFHLVRAFYYAWLEAWPMTFTSASMPLWMAPYYLVREFIAYLLLTREVNFIFVIALVVGTAFKILGGN